MSALQPNASPFALVPQDAHEALLARGMMWEECALCECGLHGGEQCPHCHGGGGRYVPDSPTSKHAD